ncbi:type IV pilus secretin PilQ [Salinibius halmophilus]|uniref:type IV pilus secretin PilQ n=1 Tax=Salinibius halmophilus TaxID=1853216 RepID=UPI001314C7D0|nr:type IV pilus secretin PilQ [Salinibius halmophilus]
MQQKYKKFGWLACISSLLLAVNAWAVTMTDIQFTSQPGDKVEAVLVFDGPAPEADSYAIESPARISVDLTDTVAEGVDRYHTISRGNTRSATVISAGERTRVVFNLTQLVPHTVTTEGNQLIINIGEGRAVPASTQPTVDNPQIDLVGSAPTRTSSANRAVREVADIDFRRGENGLGRVLIRFSNSAADARIDDRGDQIVVEVPGYALPEELSRRIDVTDFATAVRFISPFNQPNGARFVIEPEGVYEYAAYQTGDVLSIDVKPLTRAEAEAKREARFPYDGERVTYNFQTIEVRSALTVLAQKAGFNLVVSETVQGNITMKLDNVPWDQALELVLKVSGLDSRQEGNVIMVAPAEEIAAREKLELEANVQTEELAPLQTDFIQVNYAKAQDISNIISSETASILSQRGSVTFDQRTNTLIVNDIPQNIEKVRSAMAILDIPVRQVMIEARVVRANENAASSLGVRWGAGSVGQAGGVIGAGTGSLEGVSGLLGAGDASGLGAPDSLFVDLPATSALGSPSSFAVGFINEASNYLIELELSALEGSGNGEVMSQPKVIATDGGTSSILSGTQIPYATSDGIEFRDAALSLDVSPRITPDGRISMDLIINKDSKGEDTLAGPVINRNEVKTSALVNDGQTIVLGGIYETVESSSEVKTPLLGDLPIIGNLFRKTSSENSKSELLIFITPRLIESSNE